MHALSHDDQCQSTAGGGDESQNHIRVAFFAKPFPPCNVIAILNLLRHVVVFEMGTVRGVALGLKAARCALVIRTVKMRSHHDKQRQQEAFAGGQTGSSSNTSPAPTPITNYLLDTIDQSIQFRAIAVCIAASTQAKTT